MISVVPLKLDWTSLAARAHHRAQSSGLVFIPGKACSIWTAEPRCSRGAIWAAITRHGTVSPRGSSPVRGSGARRHARAAAFPAPAA